MTLQRQIAIARPALVLINIEREIEPLADCAVKNWRKTY